MSWKIKHRHRDQQLPFPVRADALAYAEQHGGLDQWRVIPTHSTKAPQPRSIPAHEPRLTRTS